jgi:tRNA-5-methyluridine54 2-sulfurtransferase
VLFGNVMRWNTDYLGRQLPVLPASHGFAKQVKPLVRLSERETAAYCLLSGIDYIVEECPMAEGNKHLGYKEALNQIEVQSPGSKAAFYFTFVDKVSARFTAEAEIEREGLHPCPGCASPTTGELCAFCKLVIKATGGPVR